MRTKARHYYPPIKKCRGSTLINLSSPSLGSKHTARHCTPTALCSRLLVHVALHGGKGKTFHFHLHCVAYSIILISLLLLYCTAVQN